MSESILMETNQAQAEQEPHRYEITPRPAHLGGGWADRVVQLMNQGGDVIALVAPYAVTLGERSNQILLGVVIGYGAPAYHHGFIVRHLNATGASGDRRVLQDRGLARMRLTQTVMLFA